MKKKIYILIKKVLPKHYMESYNAWKIFSFLYGHLCTIYKRECIDAQGHPIPWYTYPAIDYLNQMDMSNKVVFEYGCGFSTLYWAKKAKYVFSVEHDEIWFSKIKKMMPDNVSLNLVQDMEQYQYFCGINSDMYDIIVIDGKRRYMSALLALKYLKKDGFIIFDNADWYQNAIKKLTEVGLKRVDFIGFGPINSYTWNTCLFFNLNYSPVFLPDMIIQGNIKQSSCEDKVF